MIKYLLIIIKPKKNYPSTHISDFRRGNDAETCLAGYAAAVKCMDWHSGLMSGRSKEGNVWVWRQGGLHLLGAWESRAGGREEDR